MNHPFKLLATLACLFIFTPYGSPPAFGAPEENPPPPVDMLARTVVFINTLRTETPGNENDSKSATKSEGGTGFVVIHNERWYFATARHVVEGASEVRILANRPTGSVGWIPVSEIEKRLPGSTWIIHPSADLAIHPFAPTAVPGFSGYGIHGKTLYEGKAYLLDRLVAIGFPYTIGSDILGEHLSPIVKQTTLVSWPTRPVSSESNLLVEPPLYPGFSGAPVYSLDEIPGSPLFRNKQSTLIGVYVGNLLIRGENFLGRVIPAGTLIDLLNSDAVKAYEKSSKPIESSPAPQNNSAPEDNR